MSVASYARLVKCAKESAGKRTGTSGKKIGNTYLKWAFSEAAVLFLRNNPQGQRYLKKLASKHGKPKALTLLAQRLETELYCLSVTLSCCLLIKGGLICVGRRFHRLILSRIADS